MGAGDDHKETHYANDCQFDQDAVVLAKGFLVRLEPTLIHLLLEVVLVMLKLLDYLNVARGSGFGQETVENHCTNVGLFLGPDVIQLVEGFGGFVLEFSQELSRLFDLFLIVTVEPPMSLNAELIHHLTVLILDLQPLQHVIIHTQDHQQIALILHQKVHLELHLNETIMFDTEKVVFFCDVVDRFLVGLYSVHELGVGVAP